MSHPRPTSPSSPGSCLQMKEGPSPEGPSLEQTNRTAPLSPAPVAPLVCQIQIQSSSFKTKSRVPVCFDPGTWATGGTEYLFCEIQVRSPPLSTPAI